MYAACAAIRDILDVCLHERTKSDIAMMALLPHSEVRHYVQILHCHGLLARSAGRWFLTTGKGREYLACCDALLLITLRLLDRGSSRR
jgi:predicted transcriptional regulator